ncbi:MAG TPA: protoporphyrinogen oxidase [Acidobacteriaceae bacterium]|nr:protoporphyrinogen oxidase [Acidobacteriaceae bacterium]
MRHTVIIGGGITGLATAFHLQRAAQGSVAVTLIESSPRLGGKIASRRENGFLIEGGPDSFIARKQATVDLCRALGLGDELIGTSPAEHSTYVLSEGRLHVFPDGAIPLLKSDLISWPGKLRMAAELVLPSRREDGDESLASFVRRRMGSEVLDKMAGPLLAGIHSADPDFLSLQSTFAMLPEMEKKYGSVLRGYLVQKWLRSRSRNGQAARKNSSMFMTIQGGLDRLVEALATHLATADIKLNTRVLAVMPIGDHYEVLLQDGSCLRADDVVFATPAYVSAALLQELNPKLAEQLRAIRYVSTATVSLGFRQQDLKQPLDGYGFVVPHLEGRAITACSWSSAKFTERAPEGYALMRVFMGGARNESIAEQQEAVLVEMARKELRGIMGISAEPVVSQAYRWHKGNPQYDVGHLARVEEMERLVERYPGMHLAGAAYRGAGVPDCIESGARVALRIAEKVSVSSQQQPKYSFQEHAYG